MLNPSARALRFSGCAGWLCYVVRLRAGPADGRQRLGSHRSRVLTEIGLRCLGGDFAFYSATRQSKRKPATELQMARIAEHRVVPWRGRLRIRTLPKGRTRGACHPGALGALGTLGTLGTIRGIRYRGLHAPGLVVNPNGQCHRW